MWKVSLVLGKSSLENISSGILRLFLLEIGLALTLH